jgi:hypothetical protein
MARVGRIETDPQSVVVAMVVVPTVVPVVVMTAVAVVVPGWMKSATPPAWRRVCRIFTRNLPSGNLLKPACRVCRSLS